MYTGVYRHNRICTVCKNVKIENDQHFLLEYTAYTLFVEVSFFSIREFRHKYINVSNSRCFKNREYLHHSLNTTMALL